MRQGQKTSAEQVVLKLRRIEVQTAQGKSLALACKEAEIEDAVKLDSVGELGEIVGSSLMAQTLLQAVPLDNVLDQADESHGLALGQFDLAGAPHAPWVPLGRDEIGVHLERLPGVQRASYRGQECATVGLGEKVHDLAGRHAATDRQFVDGEDPIRPEGALRLDLVPIRPHVGQAFGLLELATFALQALYRQTLILCRLGGTKCDATSLDQGLSDACEIRENLQVGRPRLAGLLVEDAERSDRNLFAVGLPDANRDARIIADVRCQTAWNVDPGSASKIDPLDGCVVTPLVSPAERIEVAQPG